ncbi:hypothetical protein EJ07DRAFT_160456 [Lizonia empirigonia]|nr:hypothetical protein EJ07DRAFT_160456 [Lizonia empirigonia]
MSDGNAAELLGYLEPYDEQSRAKAVLLRRLMDLQTSKRPKNRKRKMPSDTEAFFEDDLNKTQALFRLSTIEELWDDWQLNKECNEEVCADVLTLAKVTDDKSKALKLALYPGVDEVLQNKRLYFELVKHILRADTQTSRGCETLIEQASQTEAKRVRLTSQGVTDHHKSTDTLTQVTSGLPPSCRTKRLTFQLSQFVGRTVKPDPFLSAMLASHTWLACYEMDCEIDIAACMFKVSIHGSADWILAVPTTLYDIAMEKLPEDWRETVKPNGWSISMPYDHLVGDAICYIRVDPSFRLLSQVPEVTKPEVAPKWLA